MPYIKKEIKQLLAEPLEPLANYFSSASNKDPGHLNYVLTMITRFWLPEDPRYADFNAAIGVLECAKQELYRRMVAPYEDKKVKENGDVY